MKARSNACPRCGLAVSEGLMYCPSCGQLLKRSRTRDSEITRPSVVILFVLIGIPCAFIGLISVVAMASPSLRMTNSESWLGLQVFGLIALPIFAFLSWELYRELKRKL
ncbi:MAG: hypothetical protein KF784_09810 [Fimbriimonadaceae bacterium]|nr:hypothetical protein [Fimbriimonadaceae bacterium]